MPLYSTETHANAIEGKTDNGPLCGSEVEVLSPNDLNCPWCYLFVHHAKVDKISKVLNEKFNIFIHTHIIYKREKKRIKEEKHPTIAGLVFVQGDVGKIQHFLKEKFLGLYLVKDCSTKCIATIPNDVMRSFMQVSQIAPARIRFMPHPFAYYSTDNSLVKITSGLLSGLEGYRIRIARDKCFVTTIGGMTVAIGGIYKDSFENVDEYVRQRREQLRSNRVSSFASLTHIQTEIDNGFFNPQNLLDVVAIAKHLDLWIANAESAMKGKDFDAVVEIALFLLEEIGSRFQFTPQSLDLKEITRACQTIICILERILNSTDVSTDLKEIVEVGMESLEVRFPFLTIGIG